MKQSFELSGVNCMHCVERVKKALAEAGDYKAVALN